MKLAGFIGGSAGARAASSNISELINLYPEVDSGGGVPALLGTPGLVEFAELPTAPLRGHWAGDERLFAVAGSKLYEVFDDGTYDERGDVGDDVTHSPVTITPNGTSLLIVSAGEAWIDNGTTIVSAPVPAADGAPPGSPSAEVGTAVMGGFLNQYYLAFKYESKYAFHSDLLDGTSWDALDNFAKEGNPDHIAAMLVDHSEVWLIGDKTTEVFRGTEDADRVFQRTPQGDIDIGTCAWASPISVGDGIAWVAGDDKGQGYAVHCRGYQPLRISTHAVEKAWNSYSTLADAISWTLIFEGHEWWVITFPTGNETWVYDFSTKTWFKWLYWNGSAFSRHRGRCHAFVFNKHLVGDHTTGKIYELSLDLPSDDGDAIKRVRRAPHVRDTDESNSIVYHRFELVGELGQGLDTLTGQVQLTLRWSDNDGKTWSNPVTIDAGDDGDYAWRAIWRRLGSSSKRVFEVSMISDEAKVVWTDAQLRAGKGIS